ncbi:hypothetical protein [Pedobacter agri]|uniref:Lipoprotein n=1 Tax=Pedobacter agri TaxID=454586 RepID=A0A9X3DBZ6_9SPHI|nr:hypothetical protein [Pedobacter agri]MCX3264842.1 hypothetical protein [Pedobacter agri]
MKKYFNFFLVACLLSACQNEKGDSGVVNKSHVKGPSKLDPNSSPAIENESPQTLAEIQKYFETLERRRSQGRLDSIKKDFDCEGEASAKAVYFYQGETLCMIRVEYQEHDHYSSEMSFYLAKGKPFFIFRTDYTWTFADGMAAEGITKENVKEKRYYLINDKPAKYLEKKYSYLSNERKPEAAMIVSKESSPGPLPIEIANLKKLLESKSSKTDDCLILK